MPIPEACLNRGTDTETRQRLASIINAIEGKIGHPGLFPASGILAEALEALCAWQAELGGDATDAGEVA